MEFYYLENKLLPSGTSSQTLNVADFSTFRHSSLIVPLAVSVVRPSQVYHILVCEDTVKKNELAAET